MHPHRAGNWGVDPVDAGVLSPPGTFTEVQQLHPEGDLRPEPCPAALAQARGSLCAEDVTDEDMAVKASNQLTSMPPSYAPRAHPAADQSDCDTPQWGSPPLKVKQESRSFPQPGLAQAGVTAGRASATSTPQHTLGPSQSSALDPLLELLAGSGSRSYMEDAIQEVQVDDEQPPTWPPTAVPAVPSPPTPPAAAGTAATAASSEPQGDTCPDGGNKGAGISNALETEGNDRSISVRSNLKDKTLSGRPPSRRSSGDRVSGTGASFRSAANMLGRSFTNIAAALTGDDHKVVDKWDTYDDDYEEEMARTSSTRSGMPMSPSISVRSSTGGGKVHPMHSSRVLFGVPISDVLHEKGSTRVLLWGYFQALMFSGIVAGVCIPLVFVLSLIPWHVSIDVETPFANDTDAAAAAAPTHASIPSFGAVRPNHVAFQWMLLVQIVFPLVIYAVALFVCIRRGFALPKPLVAIVVFTLCWACVVCGLFYHFDVPYWFWYLDLVLIVLAYIPCMCMVGWFVDTDEAASNSLRLTDAFVTALLEAIVAVATLVYCYFLMPMFFMFTSAWLQMLWLCVLHPLYFEVTTGFIVRKVLHRNRTMGRNHVVYFLTIVHSMVHTVALATSLQASIEPVRILAVTICLYNVSKLFWRSTVIQRDLLVERLFKGWSFSYPQDELAELSRMVSVGIITEIILENASIIITPFMMFRMFKVPIFMAVVPNTFFHNGGTYPVQTLLALIALLLGFTFAFDLIFYFLNYHAWQCLPLINTWRRIKRSQGWYLLFLIYAFACMGVLFLFLTMMILPRAAFCKSDNYCDCSAKAYQNICAGLYNSMSGDYLLEPYN